MKNLKSLFPALALLPLLACGGSVADGIDSGTDAAADGVVQDEGIDQGPIFQCPALQPGSQIFGFCLDGLVAEDRGGGFGPQPPPGSECPSGAQLHDVDLKTLAVHEEYCLSSGPDQPYKLMKLDRTLTDQEHTDLVAALKVARVVAPQTCGADKSLVQLTVRTNLKKTVTYTDSFYSCQGQGPYADGLDGVLAAFLKPK